MLLLLRTLALAITNIRLRYREWRTRPHYDYVDHVISRLDDVSRR